MQKCGLNENGKCLLLKVDMAENCHCPYYMTYVEHCDICGKVILEGGVFYNDKLYCADCGHKLGYCTTCRHLPNCAFATPNISLALLPISPSMGSIFSPSADMAFSTALGR